MDEQKTEIDTRTLRELQSDQNLHALVVAVVAAGWVSLSAWAVTHLDLFSTGNDGAVWSASGARDRRPRSRQHVDGNVR